MPELVDKRFIPDLCIQLLSAVGGFAYILSASMLVAAMGYAGPAFAESQTGKLRLVGNEPKTELIFEAPNKTYRITDMYRDGLLQFQGQSVKLDFFTIGAPKSSVERQAIGVRQVIPVQPAK